MTARKGSTHWHLQTGATWKLRTCLTVTIAPHNPTPIGIEGRELSINAEGNRRKVTSNDKFRDFGTDRLWERFNWNALPRRLLVAFMLFVEHKWWFNETHTTNNISVRRLLNWRVCVVWVKLWVNHTVREVDCLLVLWVIATYGLRVNADEVSESSRMPPCKDCRPRPLAC